MNDSVLIAIIALCGTIFATVGGVAVTRVLTSSKEELERLQANEKARYTLEDYCHTLRNAYAEQRDRFLAAGLPAGPPVPEWPPELRGGR